MFTDYKEFIKNPLSLSCKKAKNINDVIKKCENVRLSVLESLENNNFPIIIGGDHSTAMASISAGAETFGLDDYAVIYIDGHTDINTEETSLTHNIHGMPLASSIGICNPLLKIGKQNKNLRGENLFILGARSIDKKEFDIIEENKVNLFKNDLFFNDGDLAILDKIISQIGTKKVHISFDVDVLDPKFFKATGYIMEKGLSIDCVSTLLDHLFRKLNVVSFDMVEYNPLLDSNDNDFKTVIGFLKKVVLLAKKEK